MSKVLPKIMQALPFSIKDRAKTSEEDTERENTSAESTHEVTHGFVGKGSLMFQSDLFAFPSWLQKGVWCQKANSNLPSPIHK